MRKCDNTLSYVHVKLYVILLFESSQKAGETKVKSDMILRYDSHVLDTDFIMFAG